MAKLKNQDLYRDPVPKKITLEEWSAQFRLIDDTMIRKYKYYNNSEWGQYLSPPATFMVYGSRELKRLKFDNSIAALRMWGFVFNESERLFRAGQSGKKVVATMGDLGIVPTIVMAFPDCIAFYPECIWWTPFFKESTELLDIATQQGAPDAACFAKAALAAFHKKSYFPKPDMLIASTGASCDDYSCIMQQVSELGYKPLWFEIPLRKKTKNQQARIVSQQRFEKYLTREYRKVWDAMVELTKINEPSRLVESIKKANFLRTLVADLKNLCKNARVAPLPALELMTVEFGSMYGYADIDEWLRVVQMLYETAKKRVESGSGVLSADAIPIAWITPSADPYLLNIVEEKGCRVVETEYVVNQALVTIPEDIEPLEALARAFYEASLIGTTEERISRVMKAATDGKIKGALITNMLGASHCAMETKAIEKYVHNIPTLSIDVPAPFGITEQLKTRIEAFVEMMR